MAVPHPLSGKDDLRKSLYSSRKAFVIQRDSLALEAPVRLWTVLSGRSMLAGYAALEGEPDMLPILAEAAGRAFGTGLPFMAGAEAPMSFRSWRTGDELVRSPFGFRQPLDGTLPFFPDAILVPIVGFDRALNRLGHGKGHYDRALAQWPRALKIGVAWSSQEVDRVPVDPWDIPLDAVMTEKEWIA